MPTTNARKHKIPAGSEQTITRATIFQEFANSIRDIVPVASVTERSQLVAALTAAGEGPTPARPLVVLRVDARGLHRIEYTTNGTAWVPSSGVPDFTTKSQADSFGTTNGGLLTAGDECSINGVRWKWSGSAWVPKIRVATYTYAKSTPPDGQVISDGVLTAVSAETTDNTFITSLSGSTANVTAGLYLLSFSVAGNPFFTGRSFMEIEAAGRVLRNGINSGEDKTTLSGLIMVPTAGPMVFRIYKSGGGGAALSGQITIQKAE